MKEFIEYFYNLKIDDFVVINEKICIISNKKSYEFIICYENPNELYEKYVLLKNNGVCCHDILFNRNNEIICNYNDKKYMLLKDNININNKITLDDLYNPIIIINYEKKKNIKRMWEEKNDYYESVLNKIYLHNVELALNFDYFLGLSELSINILNYINFDNINFYAQHKRLKYNESIKNFFNPINIIIDSKVRDISLFIKDMFFKNKIIINDAKQIINSSALNKDEAILFLSRMIYPDYYFDICDMIINENLNNDALEVCIKKNSQYEMFLKEIYQYLLKIYNIPNIDWLIIV